MFNEDEDWSDEQEGEVLSQSIPGKTQKTNISTTSKVVGKKSLLRTLQTLGSVPEWKSEEPEQDSDSETGAAPSHSQKRKKKRKKRKPAEKSEEQQKKGDGSKTVKDEEPVPKKKKVNKPGTSNVNGTTVGESKDEQTGSAQVNVNQLQGKEKITRQQWKNKMKNKRKCKNKYRQNKLEEDVNKAKSSDKQEPKEMKVNSRSSNNTRENTAQPAGQRPKMNREVKPLKTKGTHEDGDGSHLVEGKKRQKEKSDRVVKSASESSVSGSKRKAGEVEVETAKTLEPALSREQTLKRNRLRRLLSTPKTDQCERPTEQMDTAAVPEEEEVKPSRSDILRSRMEQQLESARFRYINEVLYTTTSGEAKRMFQQDPEAFWVYHKGYTAQVQRWPTNPVDAIISYIQNRPPSLVVADFGCGDCKIARSVKNKVHSFDLAATCDLVTVGDMSKVPLGDCSVDIAVFCLSLMGTNLPDFLAEANRVLKTRGILKIAEVASRFENVRNFITALAGLGFKMMTKDTENTYFYSFEFMKTEKVLKTVKKVQLQLKPCLYKKR